MTCGGLVPFDKVTIDLYEPAIRRGIEEHNREIEAITSNADLPTFENTVVALERSGEDLSRVLGVFYPMLSADATDELMEIATRMTPLLSEHSSSVTLNEALWVRIKYVYEHTDLATLDTEDATLLRETYQGFVRSGAALEGEARERLRVLRAELSQATLSFEQNTLKEIARYELWLTADDLAGLPESAVEAAAMAAKEKGREGEYLVTLYGPSYTAFMKYSSRRDLRERLYLMYNRQCTAGEFSNIDLIGRIANLRLEIARLLGHNTFADYRLETTMAGSTQAVYDMLNQLREAYTPAARAEMEHLNRFASELEGKPVELKPWDYAYYANLERDSRYGINDELLRPYFQLDRVMEGVFGLATRLYGLRFTENTAAPKFHPEARVWTVTGRDGAYVGELYTDFFPRATKQSGAWMTNFREQWHEADGSDVRPQVTLTMNFTRPTETKPSLLTLGEVRTFVHEFGHGLHSLLSQCRYCSQSGTNVYRDFVELPSQFMENFIYRREFLDSFARHYQSGEPIPQELIDKVVAASQYGAGYACLRQLSFGLLDMAWHTLREPFAGDPFAFEREAMKPVQLFEPIEGCMMSSHFGHIFSGGYAAGYYGYKWAEVLDADVFSKFEQDGIFNPDTAEALRREILSRGSTEPPMTLFDRFRGRKPSIDALLRRDGITPKDDNH